MSIFSKPTSKLPAFPSRYLFAIGLVPIFSFRWSLPPTLGCIPKQPDSLKTVVALPGGVTHGAVTLSDVPFQVHLTSKNLFHHAVSISFQYLLKYKTKIPVKGNILILLVVTTVRAVQHLHEMVCFSQR